MEGREKCGIVGVYGLTESSMNDAFLMMNALQHRGQEGCGVCFIDQGNKFNRFVVQGLVKDLFSIKEISNYTKFRSLIGHIRYSTTGSDDISNLQPFTSQTIDGKKISLAHNGNVVNAYEIRGKLMEEGHTFSTTTDSEVILHYIVKNYNRTLNIEESIKNVINEFIGAFSIVVLFDESVIAFRDKQGFRPLVYGSKNGVFYFASEDTSLKCVDIFDVKEVPPGSMVIASKEGIKEIKLDTDKHLSHCVFELVYFAKPSSTIFHESVYNFRYECGKILATYDEGKKFDYVVPVPDSGFISAIGYSQSSNTPLAMGLVRSHFTARSFIQPKQYSRDNVVKTKFFITDEVVKGKKIVLIDDSIVRGTTMKRIVSVLKKHGVKEIHLRISSPPVKYPCYFGIDFPSEKELVANEMTIPEIAKYIGVDSIKYLEIEDMMSILGDNRTNFCNACFSGKYPIRVDSGKLRKDIFEGA